MAQPLLDRVAQVLAAGQGGLLLGLTIGVLFCIYIEQIRQFIQLLSGAELFPAEIYFLSQIPAKV